MATYAEKVRVDVVQTPNEEEESQESEKEEEEIVLTPKEKYLIENDLLLYDFTNEIKSIWNDQGFINTLDYLHVYKIIENCMNVTEVEEEELEFETDEDYESDNYE